MISDPVVLAIDATYEHGSIALTRGSALVDELEMVAPAGFGQVLYGYLDQLLKRNRIALAEVDGFAAAMGPGTFTGVRVGLACVKGLAEAMGKPAIGVSNLQAIAHFGTASLRAPVIDARRGDVYGAVYDAEGRLVQDEVVSKLPAWLGSLPQGVELLSPDFECADVPIVKTPRAMSIAVARIAAERISRGDTGDPAVLEANYVRRSDAELFWKDVT